MLTTIHGAWDHRIFYKEAESLKKEHSVTVIALGPENERQVENDINIIEFKGVLTPANHLLNCFKAFKTALKVDTDVYHCHEPSSLFLGCILKTLKNTKLVYDRHDYYPQLVKEKFENMGFKTIAKIIESIESVAEKLMVSIFVDKLIVVDKEMHKSFPGSKIIHNYPIGINGKIRDGKRFSYIGILDHRKIKESVQILKTLIKNDNEITYSIAGNAFDKSLIPENEMNISYHGVIPHNQINGFLEKTSFGVCLYDKLPRYDKAVSTKTYEYIASGIPVIASRTPGNQFIEDLGLGILIDPDNTKESVTAIEQAIPKCKEMSQKCLTMNFKWEEKMILLLYRGII